MNNESRWIKWERKYSFAILGILLAMFVLVMVHTFQFPEKLGIVSIVSTQLLILLVTITYLTGQARLDVQALYGRPANAASQSPVIKASGAIVESPE